jgi:cytochrome c551/c552
MNRLMFIILLIAYGAASAAEGDAFFRNKAEPVLRQHCFECHSHEMKIKGGLALDSKSGWEKGGESGPAVVPGKPEQSLLIKAVSHVEKDLQMPPKKMLPAAEIELLKEWVSRGAPDPRAAVMASAALKADDDWQAEFQKRLDWWSLKPMRNAATGSVDGFITAAQKAAGLEKAPPADEVTLRRRLSFVLTGLPPSSFEIQASSFEAFADTLLSSPHFGERFARHWMDVVRYTDTYGYEWDNPAKGSHEFRDYLIRAFNDDIGFDQLVREQLAGDLLPQPRFHKVAQTNESLIGPMFYHMGEHRHGSSLMFNGIHQEMVNNKIDVFSKALLATTVACARCHDHKLEAVSQRDYYALAAMFTTPRWTSRVLDAPGTNDAAIAKLHELRQSIRSEMSKQWKTPLRAETLQTWAAEHPEALKGIGAPLATPADFSKMAATWQKGREMAQQANKAFKTSTLENWVFDGDGFAGGQTDEGTPLIALEGEKVVARLLPRGWHSHALSSKLPASLRMPPQHLVTGKFVSLNLAGGEFGGHLIIADHAFQNELVAFYANTDPQWKSFADTGLKNGAQQVTIEFCTSSLNPNFPPRTDLVKALKRNDFGYDKRSWISITGIVTHDAAGTPQDELDAFTGLYRNDSTTGSWQRIAAWLNAAVQRWSAQKPEPGDTDVLNWLLANSLLPNQAARGTQLAKLLSEYRRIEADIAFPRTINSMDEREVYPLNVRGNVDVPGELIAPASLKMLHGEAIQNRLALANSLLHPEHPLTARVYVNRVWQWIFGTGLVATPDDFGRLGDKPSHPELLDWLAREFIREGWSTKKLVRRMVMTQAFRQSGIVSEVARARDPANRLLHHYPTRRLEAEAIRDSLLAISGRLDPRLYGRPILPHRGVEDAAKRIFSGPLDGHGRRSIYLQMSIMAPPVFLAGFNLPDLKLPTGRRDVTNVPSQALTMLNDPFVAAMAEHWASQLMLKPHTMPEERVRTMFQRAFAREPQANELQTWSATVRGLASPASGGLMHDEAAWTQLAHTFFNTTEFLFYR